MRAPARAARAVLTFVALGLTAVAPAHAIHKPGAPLATTTAGSYAAANGREARPPQKVLEQLPYVPGRLIVKMKDTVSACVDCLLNQGQPLAAVLGSAHLDDLNRRYGLRGSRPLRKTYAVLKSLPERRQLDAAGRQKITSAARQRFGRLLSLRQPGFASVYVLELSPWFDMERIAREYARDPAVAYAEPDRTATVQFTPNDPFFGSSGSWGQTFDDLWGLKIINAPAAWDTVRGAGVVVAVTDTGVDYGHPDISANMWTNPGETPGDGIDNDGNGFIDDVYGWNFAAGTADVFDDHGHGTHVAGTIAAVGQNALGVIGVAWESKIMALKGLDAGGSGSTSDLADAIVYAAENGAQVINASWGGFGSSQVIDDALALADGAGVVFVAAAGNSNVDVELNPLAPFFPAANHHAITVAATDHLDQKAWFSNFGTKIDVAAPGGGDGGDLGNFRTVLSLRSSGAGSDMTGGGSLVVGGSYVRQAGTSMAAPHVSGAAAVVLSAHPAYTPAQVRQALRAGADDVDAPGVDLYTGYGRINVSRSASVTVLDASITSPASGLVASGMDVTFTGTAAGADFASYALEYGAGSTPTDWTTFVGPVTTPVQNGELGVWDIRNVLDGQYTVRLRAQNTAGVNFEDRISITLDHVLLSEPQAQTIFRPSGLLDIRGAAGGNGFQRYRVEWRTTDSRFVTSTWRSDGIVLVGGGLTPVVDDVLATFDTSLITQNTDVDFQVVVTGTAGEAADVVRHVVIDPTLRAGWPQQLPGFPDFSNRMMHHVTIADLNGDGKKEILAAYGDMVYVFRDDGSPMPGWPQRLNGTTARDPFVRRSPAAADLDGDGRMEIVTTDADQRNMWAADGDTYIWHADGTPMAGWPKKIHQAYGRSPDDPYPGPPRGDFVLADVDNDGRTDIVAVVGPSLVVMDANGTMLPGWPQRWPLTYPCIMYDDCFQDLVAVGDVNGDGTKEIAVVTVDLSRSDDSDAQTLLLYASNGAIMPGFPQRVTNPMYGRPDGRHMGYINAPIMADLDGDGKLEIIALTNGMQVRVFRQNGRRLPVSPGSAKGLPNQECLNPYPPYRIAKLPPILEPPTAGDLDGDGRAEIFVSSHTKGWKWRRLRGWRSEYTFCLSNVDSTDFINLMRKGRARPGWPVRIPYPSGDNAYGPGSVAVGDIDGDLRPEVVSASGICGKWEQQYGFPGHRCFPVSAYNQDGNMLPGFPKAAPAPGTTTGLTPAIGDLAGDGLKEIVFIDFFGNILVWNVAGTPAPEAMQWPMFRHDPGHTGALTRTP